MALQKLSHSYTKIGFKPLQTTVRYILYSLSFSLLCIYQITAQEINETKEVPIPANQDTIKPVQINPEELLNEKAQDTVKKDTLAEPQLLTDKVVYKATDYMRLSRKENKMYLYDNAEIVYGEMQINAGFIVVDNSKNEVYAYGIKDSLGEYVQTPVFKQAQNVVEPDSIRFNFDTEKALIYNSRTEQNGFRIKNEISKRENDSVIYMKNVKFTTSENIEDPEYYFYARRIKFVPKKKIVTGLVNMFIADVPTPLGLPFGYFPLTEDRTSGFIIPSPGEENNRGYFLQNGGYYFAISDYLDLTLMGDYYTNGSYTFAAESAYALRYKYRGSLRFRYENNLRSERGFPDFAKTTTYNIQWTHSQDAKANPNSRFSASVNFGSSDFFQQSTNQLNTGNFLNNQISSNISYAKTFQGDPQVNVNLAATHNSNTNTGTVNLSLPNMNVSVSRVFPFAPKVGAKKGIIQNINTQYNFKGENRIQTTDDDLFSSNMFKGAKVGMQHTIPLTTNFKLFKYLSATAGTNFQENWVFETIKQSYDSSANDGAGEVVRDTIKGFDAFRTYNFSTSLGTTIYGTFKFKKGKKIEAIRHTMRPSISYSINPAFSEFYDSYTVTDDPNTTNIDETEVVEYSRFEGGYFGAPSNTFSSSIGFSLSNNVEMKVKSKDSTATEAKKITLLNNLNFSTSYNVAGDSLKLSPLSITGNIPIIQNKLDINFNAQLDPYALDNNNRKIDVWNIDNGGSLFRLTRASANFGYSFSSKDFEKGKVNEDPLDNQNFRNEGRPDNLFGGVTDFGENRSFDKDKSKDTDKDIKNYNYKIPWTLRLSYNVNYSNSARQNEISSHSIMFSGDVELAPRWSVGVSSGYDLKNPGFTYTNLRFQRDLESWVMNFNWIPFSERTSWNFFIGIKSSMLSDIKWDKRREPDRQL
ncbi:lipopolysaccharide assembly outer membrane protein LptD (OstA) [Aquimarina sp. EL_43]|uniref:putative LPS assembly protein LptD n=1 Tax=unclassified Aquimarina TaxID=2627091 RepID=UPI0018C98544|nr:MULTISPECIES: putative LPS assembly protein LptD [unclassified Aquimarina]MBG6130749.1 lipopolysaccharide assembly outer membrane protein LptD (OstA) [Aquimarina sp. EL_35]MBG6151104.1 lipopolysaccharide assembly outer membrane protein LptD (OstA) [Aquimarina sp. EL_32]MBG6169139.1 lipopolysaccharide assembly outer membrane protein LptD (OstA) [Aquimarina sp. EL_43]